jgi:hypothetical protein
MPPKKNQTTSIKVPKMPTSKTTQINIGPGLKVFDPLEVSLFVDETRFQFLS